MNSVIATSGFYLKALDQIQKNHPSFFCMKIENLVSVENLYFFREIWEGDAVGLEVMEL